VLCLLAGVIEAKPQIENFPTRGRPHTETKIRSEGDGPPLVLRIIGYDEASDELSMLEIGDACSIRGSLQVESKGGKLTGFYVVAQQVLPLRRRSVNRWAGP
jgi:hypothetical protein